MEENNNIQDIPDFFSPLDEPMKERSYSRPESFDSGEIKEPEFKGGLDMDSFETEDNTSTPEKEPKPFDSITNEGLNEMDDKDKKIACKQLVETALQVYQMSHEMAKRFAKKDENEIIKAVQDGDIDPEMQIPIDDKGTVVNPVEFFENYNEQVDEALHYDEEFGERVRPAMERVFQKRGWGMTDEQLLVYEFGKDIAMKGAIVIGLKKQANMIFNTFIELNQQKQKTMQNVNVEKIKPEEVENEIIR